MHPAVRLLSFVTTSERGHRELLRSLSDVRLHALARLVRGYIFEARFSADHLIDFTWADDRFKELFECERDEVNQRGWASFVDPRDITLANRRLAHVLSGINSSVEIRVIGLKGTARWLRVTVEPIRELLQGRISGIIGVAEDISESKRLTGLMFESVTREQRRIGIDLHDDLGQVLTGANLLLSASVAKVRQGKNVCAADLEEILGILSEAIGTTRAIAQGLAPGAIDRSDFVVALRKFAAQTSRRFGMSVDLHAACEPEPNLSPAVRDHLFRIVQEAVTNVAKHANAHTVRICLTSDHDKLQLEVIDDGIGIGSADNCGFGLVTMRYRAESIGADFEVRQASPSGTRIFVVLQSRLFGIR